MRYIKILLFIYLIVIKLFSYLIIIQVYFINDIQINFNFKLKYFLDIKTNDQLHFKNQIKITHLLKFIMMKGIRFHFISVK